MIGKYIIHQIGILIHCLFTFQNSNILLQFFQKTKCINHVVINVFCVFLWGPRVDGWIADSTQDGSKRSNVEHPTKSQTPSGFTVIFQPQNGTDKCCHLLLQQKT